MTKIRPKGTWINKTRLANGEFVEYVGIRFKYKGKTYRKQLGRSSEVSNEVIEKKLKEYRMELILGSPSNDHVATEKLSKRRRVKKVPSIAEFAQEFVIYQKEVKKIKTIRKVELHIKYFVHFCAYNTKLDKITTDDFMRYQKFRRKDNISNSTLNKERATIHTLFNLAIRMKKVSKNFINPISDVEILEEENTRNRIASIKEEGSLYLCSKPYSLPVLITLFNTGLSVSNALELKWEDIDLRNRSINVTHVKSKTVRDIPLNSNMLKLIEILRKRNNNSDYILLNSKKKPYTRNTFKDVWYTTLEYARIQDFRLTDIRATYAYRLREQNIPEPIIKYLLGYIMDEDKESYLNRNSILNMAVETLTKYNCNSIRHFLNYTTSKSNPIKHNISD